MTKKMKSGIVILVVLTITCSMQAAVIISEINTPYSQDFNTLPSSGSALSWVNNSTISGWHRNYNGSTDEPGRDSSVQSTGTNGSGVNTATGFINTGIDGSTDRSLAMRSVSYVTRYALGAVLQNSSGINSSGFSIGFTGEQWRRDSSVTNTLHFEYAVLSSSFNEGSLDIEADDLGWTRVDALAFNPPSLGGDTGLCGAKPAYQTTFSPLSIDTIVEDGEFLVVRWLLLNEAPNNHSLGIDDVSVTLLPPVSNDGPLVNFDFENHTAGDLLGGPIGTKRSTTGTGDAFDYNNSSNYSNVTVSVLSESGPSDLNYIGANVRADTVAATVPGGNMLEISPHRLKNQSYGIDISPASGTVDYLSFSVEAQAGYELNLTSFTFDMGVARGSTDTSGIGFRGQGWYSLDGGTSWTKMAEAVSINNSTAQSFSGFTTVQVDLSGIINLQRQTNEVLVALSLGDNSGRSAYSESSTSPAAHYLDNIQIIGSVDEISDPVPYISLASTSLLATEGGNNATFTLSRSSVTNVPVMVNYTLGGTALNGTDYVTLSGSVAFASNQTEAFVTIDAPDDATVETIETVTLTLTPDSDYEIIGLGSSSIVITDPNPGDYSLLSFNDEFNGAGLDTTLWQIHDNRNNVTFNNGILELTARDEGGDWVEGSIQTTEFAGKYGYYEARIKVNDADGLNNAFWLNTPGDLVSGNPIDRMEIDITEAHHDDNQSHMTLHDWAPSHWGSGGSVTIPNISDDFHTVGLEWKNDNTLVWFWDGAEQRTIDSATFLSVSNMIPLSVLFSTLVTPFAGTPGPGLDGSKMQIDYVRVWQKPGWTGDASGTWGNSANWGPDSVPTAGKTAVFNGLSANTSVSLDGSKECHSLYFDSADCAAYTLAAGAYDLTLGSAVDGVGGITINTPVVNSQNINLDLVADRELQFGNFSRSDSATLFLNGVIDATTAGESLQFCGYSPIEVDGALSGNIGSITKWGPNTVHLRGANAQTGLTDVMDGALVVGSSAALGSAGSGTEVASGASLVFAGGVQYTSPEPLTVGGTGDPAWQGALDVDGAGTAAFSGPVTLSEDTMISVPAESGLELNGSIGGAYTITKTGGGMLAINGVSATEVIVLDGNLSGTGTINDNLTIGAAGGLNVDLNTAVSDSLDVNGSVALAGVLDVSAEQGLLVGSEVVLISNDGVDAVSGIFDGLPENSEFSVDGFDMRISYVGGDGNDVTLTVLSTDAVPTLEASISLDSLQLSWINTGIEYSLQGTEMLFPLNWTTLADPIVLDSGIYQVLIPLDGTNRFFRLVWP